MTNKKTKEYKIELLRLESTKEYLENTIKTVYEKRVRFQEEIKDAYMNLDDMDSSSSYSTIMMNSKLLDDMEDNFDLLLDSRKKPYFARIDIKQLDKDHEEKLYIGKVSLYDDTMEIPMVIDWRAPIASVYYDGRLGKASYDVENDTITIDLLKKRQYTIEDGQLIDFMDVDISTSDTLLQASLENHAGDKLKDIVSTIQAEQNRIIRADINKPLIVQGVAGSGKTTIALHRIAYLIYTYSKTFYPDQFMIIAPSSLFLDYISAVLPELGANKVTQTTYIDLMFNIIGKKLKLSDSNQKLNELIRTDASALSDKQKDIIARSAAFKNSMHMKDLLDIYIAELENKTIPKMDYCIEDTVLLKYDKISSMYFNDFAHQPIYFRIDNIKKYIAPLTKTKVNILLNRIEDRYTDMIDEIRDKEKETEERRLKIVDLIHKRAAHLELINKSRKTVIKKYIDKYKKTDLITLYQDFLTSMSDYYIGDDNKDILEYISAQTERSRKSKLFEVEDLAALAYLNDKVFGMSEKLDIKMVVIDEAQDFSEFQFYVLRRLLKTERFTILGDISQGVHMYRAIHSWDYLKDNIFESEVNYLTLEQSYRTTIEIMNEANFVLNQVKLENIINARPVVRHGKKPDIKSFNNEKELISAISEQVDTWDNEKYTTMAIITKSNQESKKVYDLLKKQNKDLDIVLIDESSSHFNHRILVLSAHLAKGLEFDVVLVTTLSETYSRTPLDVKLMYVAMTRAMHRLSVFYKSEAIDYYKDR